VIDKSDLDGPLKEGVQDRAAEIVIADVLANVGCR